MYAQTQVAPAGRPRTVTFTVASMPRPAMAGLSQFGQWLDERMKARGYRDRAELSRVASITDSNLSRWMRGDTEPTLKELRKLVAPLDVRLGDLVILAGLATAEELGTKGAPPKVQTLPAPLQRVVSLLLSPRHTDARKTALLRGVDRVVDMWEEMGAAGPDSPKGRR